MQFDLNNKLIHLIQMNDKKKAYSTTLSINAKMWNK